MSKNNFVAFTDRTGTGVTEVVNLREEFGEVVEEIKSRRNADLYVFGPFVGTVALEISPDGTNFIAEGSALTVPGRLAIPESAHSARANVTAFTSGTISTVVASENAEV